MKRKLKDIYIYTYIGQHNYRRNALFRDHSPEIRYSSLQRILRNDK